MRSTCAFFPPSLSATLVNCSHDIGRQKEKSPHYPQISNKCLVPLCDGTPVTKWLLPKSE